MVYDVEVQRKEEEKARRCIISAAAKDFWERVFLQTLPSCVVPEEGSGADKAGKIADRATDYWIAKFGNFGKES